MNKFVACPMVVAETMAMLVAIVTAIITSWYVFVGEDRLLALFLFPGFAMAWALVIFAFRSLGILPILRGRFAASRPPAEGETNANMECTDALDRGDVLDETQAWSG